LLFGIDHSMLGHLYSLSSCLVTPLAWLYFFAQSSDAAARPNRLAGVVMNGIAPVSLALYTLMLYAYFAKVVCMWQLPDGGVAWMVIAFMVGSLCVAVYQELHPARLWRAAVRWLGFVALPLLVMFWVGTLYRVGQYGITSSRYYLLAVGVVMSLCVSLLCVLRWRSFRAMILFAAAAIVLTSFVPGITARAVARRSQLQRVQSLARQYGMLDGEGRFRQTTCPAAIAADHRASLVSAYEYLYHDDATATLDVLGELPSLPSAARDYDVVLYPRPDLLCDFGTLVGDEAEVLWEDSELVLTIPGSQRLTFPTTSYQRRVRELWCPRLERLPAEAFVFATPEGYTFVFNRIEVIDRRGEITIEGLSPIVFRHE
ncbi:MAG: DUF4153 domain-containing protein, partial [Bacteroidaceae bacterium]|nr:DUF4153 domain-containing protein [Bacteroidaceae bacterium]